MSYFSQELKLGIISVIWTHACLNFWVNIRQIQKIEQQKQIPQELTRFNYSFETFQLSKGYAYKLSSLRWKKAITLAVLFTAIIFSNGILHLWNFSLWTTSLIKRFFWIGNPLGFFTDYYFAFFCSVIQSVALFPSELDQFKAEKLFGFSHNSNKRWIRKYYTLSLIKAFLVPIYFEIFIWVNQGFYNLILDESWIYISFLVTIYWLIFPTAIVWFVFSNSEGVTPLPEGEPKRNIETLADRLKFPKESIFVMHSTQAKNHSNAFHIKFLGYTRLIIFESLIEGPEGNMGHGLNPSQVEAVVAHELGHHQLSHGIYGVTYLQLKVLFSGIFTAWIISNPSIYTAFGFTSWKNYEMAGFVITELFISQYVFAGLDILFGIFQRYSETRADEFAAELGYKETLQSALVKMAKDNYIYPDDDYFYTIINSTHPSILSRVKYLQNYQKID